MTAVQIPPHDIGAEEALIGAMLLSRTAIDDVVGTVDAEDFYKPAHGHIYQAVIELHGRGEPIDAVTVADHLSRSDMLEAVGGSAALISLIAGTPATTSAARYATIVADWARMRHMIGAAGEIAEMGYSMPDDIPATIDSAEHLIFNVADRTRTNHAELLGTALSGWLNRLEALYDNGAPPGAVPTGFIDLDDLFTGGPRPGQLVVVAARPGMGKSAFLGNVAIHAGIEAGVGILFVTAEMTIDELQDRFVASQSHIDLQRIRNGKLLESDWPKLTHAIGRLADPPIWIHEAPGATALSIRAEARRVAAKTGLGLIIVDYLQLLKGAGRYENRQTEVAGLARSLKELALDLHVPVIAAAQLNRGVEIRADKRPGLADLRESGELENSADIVMFLYRDDYYNEESPARGICEVHVAKHRNGPQRTIELAWIDHYGLFANMAKV